MSATPSDSIPAVVYPHPARAWWAAAVFCFAAIVSFTDRLIIGALIDPIKLSLGVNDSAVSLLQGMAFSLVYVISGKILGRLADQKHRLTLLIAGSLIWCAGTVACGLAPSFWLLFVARALVGVGEAALAPAGVSIIADSFPPERRGTAISIFFLGYFIGAPASIAIGGAMLAWANAGGIAEIPLVGALEPWRGVLVLVGLVGLTVPVLLVSLREPKRQGPREVPLSAMIKHLVADRRSLVPIYLAMGVLAIGDYGMFAWVPSLLSRKFALPSNEVGQVFGLITAVAGGLGGAVGGMSSDFFARRYGTRGRLVLSLGTVILSGISALLISFADVSQVLLGLGLWTFFSGIVSMSSIAAMQSLLPNIYSGIGIALVGFCNVVLGLGFGPTLVALATDYVVGNPALVGLAVTVVAMIAAASSSILYVYAVRAVGAHGRLSRR